MKLSVSTKYILIGGQIHKAQDGGLSFCEELIKGINHRPIKILDCLFAREKDDWSDRFDKDRNFFFSNSPDFELELASPENFIEQIRNNHVVLFQGGVPRKLISMLDTAGNWLKEAQGKVLVGSSGGADTLCKYYGVGRTGNVREGLGLLPIKFIPHWKSDYGEGLDINWDSLFEKLKSYKEDLEIVVLSEGEYRGFET